MPAPTTATARRREDARDRRSGRFGEHERTAPEVAVARQSLSFEDLDRADVVRLHRHHERMRDADVLKRVRSSVGYIAFRNRRTDTADDILSDTVFEVYSEAKKGRYIPNPNAFAVAVAQRMSYRYIDRDAHHTDIAARKKLRKWEDEFAQLNGRAPSTREIEEEADRIRLAQPAGSRPTADFRHTKEPASLHADDGALLEQLATTPAAAPRKEDASKAARVADALDTEGAMSRADVRKNVWNTLAGDDAPRVAVLTVHDDRAHRAAVTDAGGPATVAAAWAQGDISETHPAVTGLFTPFGHLPEKEREQVSGVLLRHRDYAERIWDSAMTAAVDVQRLRAIKRREARASAARATPVAA